MTVADWEHETEEAEPHQVAVTCAWVGADGTPHEEQYAAAMLQAVTT